MTTFEGYQILQTLGQGSFGKVKLAQKSQTLYAIKFPTESNTYNPQTLQKIFQKQQSILSQLNHKNIIHLHETIYNGNYIKPGIYSKKRNGLVFQYAPYNLGHMMELGALEEKLARGIFRQLLDGLAYLHSRNVIHRDVKPENILFDGGFGLKLCDFGLSVKVEGSAKPKTVCGSDLFKSPEMLMRKNYNGLMNDLFAAGVTLFILVTGKGPFNTATPQAGNYQYIAMNYFQKFWTVYEKKVKYSNNFKSLINAMLAFDPTYRLSIAEIMSHPWMQEETMMGEQIKETLTKRVHEIYQRKKLAAHRQQKPQKPVPNRRRISPTLSQSILPKHKNSSPSLHLLTDRFVPRLHTYKDLQNILSQLPIELDVRDGSIFIIRHGQKGSEGEEGDGEQQEGDWRGTGDGDAEGRLVVEVRVVREESDGELDCLRFWVRDGSVVGLRGFLQEFDLKVYQPLNMAVL